MYKEGLKNRYFVNEQGISDVNDCLFIHSLRSANNFAMKIKLISR